jgi:hypothetical protein
MRYTAQNNDKKKTVGKGVSLGRTTRSVGWKRRS